MQNTSEVVSKFFPLNELQVKKLNALYSLYEFWNQQINVISRKDFENFTLHHVLHSLAIAKVVTFPKGAKVIDIGCGGGFPGIPLAILFPEVEFYEIDSIGKKIKVVQEISQALDLKNIHPMHARAEEVKMKADFVISRAVADMSKLVVWTKHFKAKKMLLLKGGDLDEEINPFQRRITSIVNVESIFKNSFFAEKVVIEYDYL